MVVINIGPEYCLCSKCWPFIVGYKYWRIMVVINIDPKYWLLIIAYRSGYKYRRIMTIKNIGPEY